MSEWIFVYDQLPDDFNGNSKPVLVHGPDIAGGVWLGYFVYSLLNEWRLYGSSESQDGKITHWMPLPEPPTGHDEVPK